MTVGPDQPDTATQGSEMPTTGSPAADAAGERLRAVDDAPLEEHVAIYDDVHRQLQEALTDVDDA